MYTMQQAERLAADFLRQETVGSDHEAALIDEGKCKAEKGEFFYFTYQSVEYIATKDDRYALYGPPAISVHNVTGACRFVSMRELQAAGDPFNWW
jgi:hypothetical protein